MWPIVSERSSQGLHIHEGTSEDAYDFEVASEWQEKYPGTSKIVFDIYM